MNYNIEINNLIRFIENNPDFNIIRSNICFYNNHLGAVLADIILQAGLNYKTVVFPRVLNIYKNYESANDLNGLLNILEQTNISEFLQWKNEIKISRFRSVIEYLLENRISDSYDLSIHLQNPVHANEFLNIQGIGNKTLDYFLKLMNVETIAVDRHIINFLVKANIEFVNYNSAKKIVEYTADILEISRRDMDYSIWSFMSSKNKPQILELEF
ncbi:hypothetical protein PYS58_07805 [Chryseobacterium indologenes]|uniref:hypothetical protein n=1 Tax=Chryseobacterium indologenes TaxID=253 RepID=UPI0023E8A856|nr:hypothetical protein [Chryseobacterium indologenes]WET51033.1 hypothetical protein PYS58_07805 [Chryseobacterium indologenes]